MIKADIVKRICDDAKVTNGVAYTAIETILDTMKKALARGERIELRGFGVFKVANKKTGLGRNPKTGEEVRILSGKTVKFKPGKEIKNLEPVGSASQPSPDPQPPPAAPSTPSY